MENGKKLIDGIVKEWNVEKRPQSFISIYEDEEIISTYSDDDHDLSSDDDEIENKETDRTETKLRDLSRGLVTYAKIGKAWIVTNGRRAGIAKHIGKEIKKDPFYDSKSKLEKLVLLGISYCDYHTIKSLSNDHVSF